MSGTSEAPELAELHGKMTQLEAQNAELIARIMELEKRATNSHDAFIRLAQQVGGVLHDLGLIDLQIVELAEKAFPGYVRTQRQIMNILTPPDKAGQQEKDQSG